MPYHRGGSNSLIAYRESYLQEVNQSVARTPVRQETGMELKTEKPVKNVDTVS